MSAPQTNTTDTFATWRSNTNTVSTNVGDPASLTTTDKTSAVVAINELDAEVGTLSSLTTTVQSTLVGAINEVDAGLTSLDAALDALDVLVGDLDNLDTTDKTSIVNAVNEILAAVSVAGNINTLTGTLSVSKGGTGQTSVSDIVAGSNKVTVTGGTGKVIGGGNVTVNVDESKLVLPNMSGTLSVVRGGTGANTLGSIVTSGSIVNISNGANKVVGSDVTITIVTTNITSLGTLTSLNVGGTAQIDGAVTLNAVTPPNAPNVPASSVTLAGHLTTKGYVDQVAQSGVNAEVEFDSDWVPAPLASGSAGTFNFAHGMSARPDFVMAWVKTNGNDGTANEVGGSELISPQMDTVDQNYHTGYLNYTATNIVDRKHCASGYYAVRKAFFGDIDYDLSQRSQNRYIAVNKDANYDSGWFAVSTSTAYVKAHNIGVFPQLVVVELADTADPDTMTWRVPKMGSVPRGSNWAQCNVVAMDSNNLTVQTGTKLAEFIGPTGAIVNPSAGFCRVLAYNWTPDYDSGWLAISNTAGDRDKIIKHGLNRPPSIISVYVTNAIPGSSPGTQVVQALGSYMNAGSVPSTGTIVYGVTKNFVYIKGGSTGLANFIDSTGVERTITTGASYRVCAWR